MSFLLQINANKHHYPAGRVKLLYVMNLIIILFFFFLLGINPVSRGTFQTYMTQTQLNRLRTMICRAHKVFPI